MEDKNRLALSIVTIEDDKHIGVVSLNYINWIHRYADPAIVIGEKKYQGKLGDSLTIDEGYDAARLVGLNLLSTLKTAICDLDRINQIVKVLGMVNSTPDFNQHPQVINGFSELMTKLYGDKGRHARSAVGLVNLPFDIPVEIEMIVEIAVT